MSDKRDEKTAAEFGAEGGRARARRLTREQRREISRTAAEARWMAEGKLKYPRATHESEVNVAGFVIPCAVLEDGTRVLARYRFVEAIGRKGKVKGGRKYDEESKVPVFLTAENLKPFISNELLENSNPIQFRSVDGGMSMGYQAELMTQVCDVFIKAKFAGVLRANQEHIAERCRVLNGGFAAVGIAALIDEATGYQDVRARDALAKILETYVAKEIQPWISTFPPDFYKELCRLKHLPYTGSLKKPQYFGHLTNNIVYKRLAPGVLAELRKKNPVTEKGRRKTVHHRWLTPQAGHPKLQHHLGKATGLMLISSDWESFETLLNKHMPVYKHFPLFDGPREDA